MLCFFKLIYCFLLNNKKIMVKSPKTIMPSLVYFLSISITCRLSLNFSNDQIYWVAIKIIKEIFLFLSFRKSVNFVSVWETYTRYKKYHIRKLNYTRWDWNAMKNKKIVHLSLPPFPSLSTNTHTYMHSVRYKIYASVVGVINFHEIALYTKLFLILFRGAV